ncbi:MAG: hypothetical protein COY38_04535 [Candidatus Aenigmarchaeota archaeon CG_4_10_14_0_8_um_filter_37_24]|nr:AbrB/MazE/SpoVT family DNA-binding domain-containing protein [Candidatus Aenigmarchaeota archaeon]OIN85556.1 MAG: hypothetical protein AUJ50_04810 [Candidatus Aenigmarchaeota archaeon CG1_02_38_14]PIW40770.1 MAG: hypothetical protein COW21_05395 [Candidatus Aenigmarchaeota archaeon CG15_BIG_FIL_POST_REV_8_21_14_020_37_27]PIX50351.1 MAG: hypothetical protein COZ52_04605 [Candidatus Aenigmarchaeota archaeon CG_4_8_14_3_um_filter_37_24]PIY34968.1 MAG: hypothetical protein COZ04_04995 [Candidatu
MLEKPFEEIPEITRVSSKGQIVIPKDIREKLGIKTGSIFAMNSYNGDMIVLRKLDTKMTRDDLETLKLLEEAWRDIEEGRYSQMSKEKFLKELDKW